MAGRQQTRLFSHRPTQTWQPLDDGATASVTGMSGTLIVTISRHSEPAGMPSRPGDLMSVVVVAGDIDLDSAPLLERALLPAVAARPWTCLDMRRTDFFGAAGVHVLIAAHRRAAVLGHRLVLRGPHGITAQVLAQAGVDRLIATVE